MASHDSSSDPFLQPLFDWIESVPDTREAHVENIYKLNDVVRNLISYGEAAVEPLIKYLLPSEKPWTRWAALWALREIGDPRAREPIWKMLQDSHKGDQIDLDALRALGKLKDERIFEIAVDLVRHPNSFGRSTALYALGDLGDLRAVKIIVPLLIDPNREIQDSAINALHILKDQRAVTPLPEFSAMAALDEREQVTNALGSIGAVEAIPYLKNILDNIYTDTSIPTGKIGHVLNDALDALALIDDPSAVEIVKAAKYHINENVRRHARRALQKRATNTSTDNPLV